MEQTKTALAQTRHASRAGVRVSNVLTGIVFVLFAAVFLFLSVCGLLQTSVIDAKDYIKEHILFYSDSAWLNLGVFVLLAVLAAAAVFLLGKRVRQKHVRIAKVVLVCWTFGLSLFWSLGVQTVPTADSRAILNAALLAAQGDFSFFADKQQYFQMFPFQLGIVGLYEIFFRVFGGFAGKALYAFNAVSLAAACLAVVQTAQAVFKDRRVTLATIVLLALCIQPVLFSSFLYGVLPGLAAMAWAAYFLIRFLQTEQKLNILWIALLCAFGVAVKPNNWIAVAAFCIVLAVSLLTKFRPARILCMLAVVIAPLVLTYGVRFAYERRADVDLGGGTPQTAWLVMGLSDSSRAPGWYNGYTYSVLKDSGWDTDLAAETVRQDLKARMQALAADPDYAADFFFQKVLSQWNEPSFESIWSSKAREHEEPVSAFIQNVYDGALGDALTNYFEHYTQFVYVFAAVSLHPFFRRRKTPAGDDADGLPVGRLEAAVPVLIVLGGFCYHLLFEAKSYYAIPYFVLLMPYAAFGLVRFARLFERRAQKTP